MKRRALSAVVLLVACVRGVAAEARESEHRKGPHGVEGWTVNESLDDHPGEQFAGTLMVARRGRVVRRIEGDPLIWEWRFWADGRQVAYETGSLHFTMQCVLVDVWTGKRLAHYDCYHDVGTKPNWVTALQKQ